MDKDTSLDLSAQINALITRYAPQIDCTPAALSPAEEAEFRRRGLLTDDHITFSAVWRFCEQFSLTNVGDEFLRPLFRQAKCIDAKAFRRDPYLSGVTVPTEQVGDHLLTTVEYARGEFFQYDMPDLYADIVVPKLGFFTEPVRFPSLYEGAMPWISVCPSEINSMTPDIRAAHGRVLVLGLGLGYYPFVIARKKDVEAITIVELSPQVLSLFREKLLPQFPNKEKITLVEGDAVHYLNDVRRGEFDFVFSDIWEGPFDGAELYVKLRRNENRLPGTEFRYWIENSIRWYLGEEKR